MQFYNEYYWGMHFTWWVIWIVIVLMIFLWPRKRIKNKNPLEILKKQFAEGEITKEQFEAMKQTIDINDKK
ncbi:MAG: SHOCT domain-containing protein [Flavobacteriaceae bacterium]|nr:SHOCT domain-containing protein [Flavobacteriaceae bacterium]HZJ35285.1 SHOCT domain-containing protein [Gillisia sp.]